MYSICSKYFLFASVSYVQESFKLNEVNGYVISCHYACELINQVLSISEYVFEKHKLLLMLMKNLHKVCKSNYVISCAKRLSSIALCRWSGGFNFRV